MTDAQTRFRAFQKPLALVAVCLSALALPLSFTGPAVALSALGHALGGSPLALNWVTNAFMLAFGSLLMLAGALADRFGRRRLFLIGLAGFTLSAAALSVAPDLIWFDLLRALQGIAGAMSFSSGMAALAQEFDGPARTRVFSLIGTTFGLGLAFGPILSGSLIEALGWQSMLRVIASVSGVALLLGFIALRETRDPEASTLDWAGAGAFTLALSLLTYGVLLAPERGWSDGVVMALLIASVAVATGFVFIELRVARPMLDLSLFRYPRFVGVQLLAAAPAYSFVVLLILLPIRFVGIEGLSEIAAGRMMAVLSAPLLVMPLVAAWLTRWLSAGAICGTGLLVTAVALGWLANVPAGDTAAMAPPLAMIGIGIGLPWGLMDGLAVSVVPKERAGMAAGLFSTTRVAGEGIALAVVGALLAGFIRGHLVAGDQAAAREAAQYLVTGNLRLAALALPVTDLRAAYAAAFHDLLLVLAAITVVTAIVIFVMLHRRSAAAPVVGAE